MDFPAVGVQEVQGVLADMQKNLECPICLELIREPVSTKCDHIFCKFCILKLLRKKKGPSQCPLCKNDVTRRSLQESPRFQQLVEGLRHTIRAFERDTGIQFSSSQESSGSPPPKHAKEDLPTVRTSGYGSRAQKDQANSQGGPATEASLRAPRSSERRKHPRPAQDPARDQNDVCIEHADAEQPEGLVAGIDAQPSGHEGSNSTEEQGAEGRLAKIPESPVPNGSRRRATRASSVLPGDPGPLPNTVCQTGAEVCPVAGRGQSRRSKEDRGRRRQRGRLDPDLGEEAEVEAGLPGSSGHQADIPASGKKLKQSVRKVSEWLCGAVEPAEPEAESPWLSDKESDASEEPDVKAVALGSRPPESRIEDQVFGKTYRRRAPLREAAASGFPQARPHRRAAFLGLQPRDFMKTRAASASCRQDKCPVTGRAQDRPAIGGTEDSQEEAEARSHGAEAKHETSPPGRGTTPGSKSKARQSHRGKPSRGAPAKAARALELGVASTPSPPEWPELQIGSFPSSEERLGFRRGQERLPSEEVTSGTQPQGTIGRARLASPGGDGSAGDGTDTGLATPKEFAGPTLHNQAPEQGLAATPRGKENSQGGVPSGETPSDSVVPDTDCETQESRTLQPASGTGPHPLRSTQASASSSLLTSPTPEGARPGPASPLPASRTLGARTSMEDSELDSQYLQNLLRPATRRSFALHSSPGKGRPTASSATGAPGRLQPPASATKKLVGEEEMASGWNTRPRPTRLSPQGVGSPPGIDGDQVPGESTPTPQEPVHSAESQDIPGRDTPGRGSPLVSPWSSPQPAEGARASQAGSETPNDWLGGDMQVREQADLLENDAKEISAVFGRASGTPVPGRGRRRQALKLASSEEDLSSEDDELPCFQELLRGQAVSTPARPAETPAPRNGSSHRDVHPATLPSGASPGPELSQESEGSESLFSSGSLNCEDSAPRAGGLGSQQSSRAARAGPVDDRAEGEVDAGPGGRSHGDQEAGPNSGEASESASEASQPEDSSALSTQCDILTTQQKNAMQDNLKKLQQEMAALEAVLEGHESPAASTSAFSWPDSSPQQHRPGGERTLVPGRKPTQPSTDSEPDPRGNGGPNPPASTSSRRSPPRVPRSQPATVYSGPGDGVTQERPGVSERSQGAPRPSGGRMSIVASGLTQPELVLVQKFARKTQSVLSSQFTAGTTHVVMKTDAEFVCERTLKYFLGVAGGRWVVSHLWVTHSFQEGKVLAERDFEVRGDVVNGRSHGGPRRARVAQDRELFAGLAICCYGPFTDMHSDHLEWMVELGGALLVKKPSLFPARAGVTRVLVVEPEAWDEDGSFQGIKWACLATVVTREWVLDSVARYERQEFDPYLVAHLLTPSPP
ncbi:breast cancer type 1 susceptibility protein [Tachyglossus aculeatus]|uniref:breast cancer type 1 susceptibility protein n=1 Tax=Tachyglossus aculeatus TaxID=9261 RepID=UPI0018F6B3DA|nr:breast cancer type 1 susceptibility protein [Tachyglossus aculeatus]